MHVYTRKEQGEGGKSGGRKDVRKIFTEKLIASALGGGILGTFTFASILQCIVWIFYILSL